MDPETSLKNNTFKHFKMIKPEASFNEEDGIKQFETISMVDDTNCLVISNSEFDCDYNFLGGTIRAIKLDDYKYDSLKAMIGDEISLKDLADYDFEREIIFNNGPLGRSFCLKDGDSYEECSNDYTFDELIIEDRQLRSTVDKMNNFIFRYGDLRNLPTSAFKEVEKSAYVETPMVKVISINPVKKTA